MVIFDHEGKIIHLILVPYLPLDGLKLVINSRLCARCQTAQPTDCQPIHPIRLLIPFPSMEPIAQALQDGVPQRFEYASDPVEPALAVWVCCHYCSLQASHYDCLLAVSYSTVVVASLD